MDDDKIREIMLKYRLVPDDKDVLAAVLAAEKFFASTYYNHEVSIFHAAFYRGIYWALEKMKENKSGEQIQA